MNYLIFSAGAGFGAFVTVMASIWLVGRVNKRTSDRQKEFNDDTKRLMEERNQCEARSAESLKDIADCLDAMSGK